MIPVETVRKPNTTDEIERQPTETSDKVVEDREEEGLGLEGNVEECVYREERRDGEDENIQPVELINYIVPLEWRQGLLILQRPRNVVVRYVDVDGGNGVLALRESGRRGRLVFHLRGRDRRHGG